MPLGPQGTSHCRGIVPFCDPLKDPARGRPQRPAVAASLRAGPQGKWAEGRLGGSGVSSGGPAFLSPIQVHSTGGQTQELGPVPSCPLQERPVVWPSVPGFPLGWLGTEPLSVSHVSCVLVPRPLTSLSDSCSLAPSNPHSLWPKAGSPTVRRPVSLLGCRDRAHKAWLPRHPSSGTSGPQGGAA